MATCPNQNSPTDSADEAGNVRLEAACARALALGSCRYQTVKNILSAGQDHLPIEPPTETNPTPTHANIRGADYYATTATEEDRC